jgi:hypothetical protein
MKRDAYSSFADSPDLAEQIETRLERAEIEKDLRPLRGLFKFWNEQGRPLMFFEITPGGTDVEVHGSARQYFLPYMMRGHCNDS